MIQVRVASLAIDSRGQPVLLLEPVATAGRVLPIWIGATEATAIVVVLEGEEIPRPLTHDLLTEALQRLGALVEKVAVTRIEDGTYFAEISLRTRDGLVVLDARPSDAVALALRTRSPIWVSEEVFAASSVETPEAESEATDEAGPIPSGDTESELAAFNDFLEQVDPEDFRG
jgi:bifunctional DNase/RNase